MTVSPFKNLLYHIQNSSGEEPAPPLLKLSPISHPFQQIIGTELFNIFLTFRPCLLPSNTEEITKTAAPSSLLRITLGRQEAVVIKQETSQLAIRRKSLPIRIVKY